MKFSADKLIKILEREVSLHGSYQELIRKERAALTHFKSDEVENFASAKEEVGAKLSALSEERQTIVDELFGTKRGRLSLLMNDIQERVQREKVKSLVSALTQASARTKKEAQELAQVLDFSLRIVNGTLSIICSAGQQVTRTYTRYGGMQEKYHQLPSSGLDRLKEA